MTAKMVRDPSARASAATGRDLLAPRLKKPLGAILPSRSNIG
jgi:hypothetical protein